MRQQGTCLGHGLHSRLSVIVLILVYNPGMCGTRRREGLELAPLLERHTERSVFHAPLFTAVTHNYQGVLATLFDHGLQLTPAISTEHLLLSPEARLPGARPSGREFVRQPRPGETESLSLLMCAASVGNQAAVQQLHGRGAIPPVLMLTSM